MVYSRYDMSSGPGVAYQWDINVCHKWYFVQHSAGNVPDKGQLPSDMWDGVESASRQKECMRLSAPRQMIECVTAERS